MPDMWALAFNKTQGGVNVPKYHPKSNNGVFSKKQRKASRFMSRHRVSGSLPKSSPRFYEPEIGLMARVINKLFRRKP